MKLSRQSECTVDHLVTLNSLEEEECAFIDQIHLLTASTTRRRNKPHRNVIGFFNKFFHRKRLVRCCVLERRLVVMMCLQFDTATMAVPPSLTGSSV